MRQKWDTSNNKRRNVGDQGMKTTMFFFTEIPNDYGAMEPYELFGDFG